VGVAVGFAVGVAVGFAVGVAVGAAVGVGVGAGLDGAATMYVYANTLPIMIAMTTTATAIIYVVFIFIPLFYNRHFSFYCYIDSQHNCYRLYRKNNCSRDTVNFEKTPVQSLFLKAKEGEPHILAMITVTFLLEAG
jgi:hypothetical protein